MGNEIIVLDEKRQITVSDLFTKEGIDEIIKEVKARVDIFTPDMTTEEGRKEIASFAYKIARTKSTIDTAGKNLTEGWREKIKVINNERNRLCDALDGIKEDVRRPLTEWENEEKQRIEECKARIEQIENFKSLRDIGLEQFNEAIKKVNSLLNYKWEEFEFKAKSTGEKTIKYLEEEKQKAIKIAEERAELEKLRKEKEDRERKDHEEKIAKEAAEKAKREAEEKAKIERQRMLDEQKRKEEEASQAKLKAEKEAREREAKLEAEKKAMEQAKIEAERKALEAEEKAKIAALKAVEEEKARAETERKRQDEEKAKREADEKHREKINKEIVDDMISQVCSQWNSNEKGKILNNSDFTILYSRIVGAIMDNRIRHLSIKY